ncbi:hypothetical protein AVEN_215449-1 [Araneus ventricosus]|uniref:Tc1-like transposase DDE domain-containing protein n=1 Tax=Araneus ventricosus TaxID=182803 RepID=A0A4Y2JS11_ARAVE|nr:hypothetical protein AVEN_215449-1 [Araneus ventricosus]
MDPACQVGTVQGHGGSIMVWGVFSWQLLGSLKFVPTSHNVIRYVELLGNHLHTFMLYCHTHGNGVFQQDNCTSHRSRLTTAWLDELSSNFSVMNWPPRSPDLTSIEHLWDVLDKGVKAHQTTPATLTELWPKFCKPFLWNASANLLNLCLVMWQPLSRPQESQLGFNLLSLIQWHFSV